MKASPLRLAIAASLIVGGFAASPAFADQIADLRAELARQKEIAAQQQARLEALESKLNATLDLQRAVAENDAKEKAADKKKLQTTAKLGDGLKVTYGKDEVNLYGLLDLTVSRTTNTDAKGGSTLNVVPGFFSGSRWGLQGQHNLNLAWDPTMNIVFKLESEYQIPDGAMSTSNVLFNRDAWIGFQGETIGKLTFGRQNTLGRDFADVYGHPFGKDAVGLPEGGWTNNNFMKQQINYVGSATGTRYNSGVVWKKQFGDFIGGLGYQFGGASGKVSRNTSESAALAYNGSNFTLAGDINEANVNGFTHQSYTLGGNVRFGAFRVNAAYYHYEAEQAKVGDRKDNAYALSGSLRPDKDAPWEYFLGWETIKAHNAGLNSSGTTLNPFADTSTVAKAGSGDRDSLYAAVFYHFDKRAELYVVADHLSTSGKYFDAAAHGFTDAFLFGTGLRFRF